jgi:hypothetical protein
MTSKKHLLYFDLVVGVICQSNSFLCAKINSKNVIIDVTPYQSMQNASVYIKALGNRRGHTP